MSTKNKWASSKYTLKKISFIIEKYLENIQQKDYIHHNNNKIQTT